MGCFKKNMNMLIMPFQIDWFEFELVGSVLRNLGFNQQRKASEKH